MYKCNQGSYRRSYKVQSYTKSDGTKVNGYTVKSKCEEPKYIGLKFKKNSEGKTKIEIKQIPDKEGFLKSFGYSLSKTNKERKEALDKVIMSGENPASLFRRLNLIRTNQKSNLGNYKILISDMKYLKTTYS